MYFILTAIVVFASTLFFTTNAKPLYASKNLNDTFYLVIPPKLNKGRIDTLPYGVYNKDAAVSYVFGFDRDSPHAFRDAGYFLDVLNKEDTITSNLPKKTLDPYQLMDSLTAHGRPFFRQNIFYAVFEKEKQFYIHKAKGEYIYSNFDGDYESVTDSTIQRNR